MSKDRPRMGRASYRPKSRAKQGPPVAAEGVEATPGVMNVQGLALELAEIRSRVKRIDTPFGVIELIQHDVGYDFWDQPIDPVPVEAFIHVPLPKSCRCVSGRW
jgi:hypothetical protein